jgi:RecA-family ATPase
VSAGQKSSKNKMSLTDNSENRKRRVHAREYERDNPDEEHLDELELALLAIEGELIGHSGIDRVRAFAVAGLKYVWPLLDRGMVGPALALEQLEKIAHANDNFGLDQRGIRHVVNELIRGQLPVETGRQVNGTANGRDVEIAENSHSVTNGYSAYTEVPPNEIVVANVPNYEPLLVEDSKELLPELELDLSQWDHKNPPEREWTVYNRVPARNVTMLSGDGAAGKSLIALQLAHSMALGRPDWLGALIERGHVLFVSAEDDEAELVRRSARILKHYGATFADLQGRLHLYDLSGEDATLVVPAPGRTGLLQPTKLLLELEAMAIKIKPRLIVLDALADVFAGNENTRTDPPQFIRRLRTLAKKANSAILLISHPSLTGLNSGSGLSGSTAWHNSVRARMYFTACKPEPDYAGACEDDGLRQLAVRKSNYGPHGEIVRVRWRDGVFVLEPSMGSAEQIAANAKVDDSFLRCLDACAAQKINLSPSPNAKSYPSTMFIKLKLPDAQGCTKAGLNGAHQRLLASGRIKVEIPTAGPESKRIPRIVRSVPGDRGHD